MSERTATARWRRRARRKPPSRGRAGRCHGHLARRRRRRPRVLSSLTRRRVRRPRPGPFLVCQVNRNCRMRLHTDSGNQARRVPCSPRLSSGARCFPRTRLAAHRRLPSTPVQRVMSRSLRGGRCTKKGLVLVATRVRASRSRSAHSRAAHCTSPSAATSTSTIDGSRTTAPRRIARDRGRASGSCSFSSRSAAHATRSATRSAAGRPCSIDGSGNGTDRSMATRRVGSVLAEAARASRRRRRPRDVVEHPDWAPESLIANRRRSQRVRLLTDRPLPARQLLRSG